MITDEQAKQLKEQLLNQLEYFPEEKREEIKKQVQGMSKEQFEKFLIKNKLIQPSESSNEQCVFCSIVEGKIPSYKIDENKEAIAILEINPLTKGHMMVVPKKHAEPEKIPQQAFSLAKKISKKIKSKLSPQEIKISTNTITGHSIIEILPIYDEQPTERKKATKEELEELQKLLKIKKSKPRKKQTKKTKSQNLPKVKPRIP